MLTKTACRHDELTPRAREVAEQVRRKRKGRRRRPRRIPEPAQPDNIERAYARELFKIVALTEKALEPLFEAIPDLVPEEERQDAGDGDRIRRLTRQARRTMSNALEIDELEDVGRKIAKRTAKHQRVQLLKQARAAVGVDILTPDTRVGGLVDDFVRQNVAYITDIPDAIIQRVGDATVDAVRKGIPRRSLMKTFQSEMKIGRNRARIIARDQIGSLLSQITKTRHEDLGLTHFIWRTAGDQRVRDEHEELEGERFSYASGGHPSEGMPGEPILCRCYQEPDFSDIVNEANQ